MAATTGGIASLLSDYYASNSTNAQKSPASTASSTASDASASKTKLTHDDFMKLFTVQMTKQNPLSPLNYNQLLSQMSQYQALDEQVSMTDTIAGMRTDQQLSAASTLIGKEIEGTDLEGNAATGMVQRAVLQDGQAYLVLADKTKVPYANVTTVQNPTTANAVVESLVG